MIGRIPRAFPCAALMLFVGASFLAIAPTARGQEDPVESFERQESSGRGGPSLEDPLQRDQILQREMRSQQALWGEASGGQVSIARLQEQIRRLQKRVAELDALVSDPESAIGQMLEADPKVQYLENLKRQYEMYAEELARQDREANADKIQQIRQKAEQYARQIELYSEKFRSQYLQRYGMEERPLPDDATPRAFRLKYIDAQKAAELVQQVFADKPFYVAADTRSNMLLLNAADQLLEPVGSLLKVIDVPKAEAGERVEDDASTGLARPYQIRVFWLADTGDEDSLRDPAGFLPASVITAVKGLGVETPGLVVQASSAVALAGHDSPSSVQAESYAALNGRTARLQVGGALWIDEAGRARVDAQLNVSGALACELNGSIVAPIGHFVVLGTAESLLATRDGDAQEETTSSSRSAFVLQVVESDSFAPDDSSE